MNLVKQQSVIDPDTETAENLNSNALNFGQTLGREGSHIEHLLYKGISMAVFTSGGDSSGFFS